nr:hypothetical protein [uncultured Holophaga sp.]
MRNLVVAIALTLVAIGLVMTRQLPQNRSLASPRAVAQARTVIEELPLPHTTKEAYFERLRTSPEAHLPYLVEEARRAVNSSMDAQTYARIRFPDRARDHTGLVP